METKENQEFVFSQFFSTGNNTKCSFEQKLKVIRLICFLTSALKKAYPEKFKNVVDVLNWVFDRKLDVANTGLDQVLIGWGILCEDLMYSNNDEIQKPEGFHNPQEIKEYIKNYFNEEWMPF